MLTDAERTLCIALGFEDAAGLLLEDATGQPVEQAQSADLKRGEYVPVAGLASEAREENAPDLEELQNRLPAGYRAWRATRGFMGEEIVVAKTDDTLQIVAWRATSAPNYELTHDEIMAQLNDWKARYGITVWGAGGDWINVKFEALPDDAAELANEVYDFCPDIIEQHFACFGDLADSLEDEGEPQSAAMRELLEGVSWDDDEAAGLELLQRSLQRGHVIPLWWD